MARRETEIGSEILGPEPVAHALGALAARGDARAAGEWAARAAWFVGDRDRALGLVQESLSCQALAWEKYAEWAEWARAPELAWAAAVAAAYRRAATAAAESCIEPGAREERS